MFKKIIPIITVIIAGEAIFMLPFLIPRLLRPLMIESWGVSNTTIGFAFSAYGFSALISYLLGGPLADKYSPKNLISLSLLLTGIGGSVLLFHPTDFVFISVYGYFGISTTFLMWSALIKLTHNLGGENQRSSAMGILDSGRGLIAAIVSSFLVWLISRMDNYSSLDKLQNVYLAVIIFTLIISVCIFFFLKNSQTTTNYKKKVSRWSLKKCQQVLKNKQVWLLGIVVLSSYCGYKNIDNYSIYFVDVLEKSSAQSSFYTSIIFWMRPVGALLSGFFADWLYSRYKSSRFLFLSMLLFLSCLSQAFLSFTDRPFNIFYIMLSILILSSLLIYALRAIYFAVFDDMKIPASVLGTTIGIVSVIGFLPDFFFGSFTGYLIDATPGLVGFQQVYLFVSTMLFIGSIASVICWRSARTKRLS